jgi:hypothetical protein
VTATGWSETDALRDLAGLRERLAGVRTRWTPARRARVLVLPGQQG